MQAIVFLLDSVISFFCVLFLLRFMMQAMRVSFAGQPGNFVVALTNWAVKPLRRIIPGIGGLDWSTVFAAFALQLLLSGILIALSGRFAEADIAGLVPMILWFALRAVFRLAVYIMIGALIDIITVGGGDLLELVRHRRPLLGELAELGELLGAAAVAGCADVSESGDRREPRNPRLTATH